MCRGAPRLSGTRGQGALRPCNAAGQSHAVMMGLQGQKSFLLPSPIGRAQQRDVIVAGAFPVVHVQTKLPVAATTDGTLTACASERYALARN